MRELGDPEGGIAGNPVDIDIAIGLAEQFEAEEGGNGQFRLGLVENRCKSGTVMQETEARTGQRQLFATRHRISAIQTVVVSGVAMVVIVASSVTAADGSVAPWEESVLLFFNGWYDWLEPPMWVLQQVGVIGTPIVVALIVYYFTRRWQYLVAFAAILPLKLVIEKGVVKKLVERDRPFESVGPHINVRGPAFEGLSFPSGHATTVFAVGILLAVLLPSRWRPVPVVWAGVVAIARLYYGEHNFLDVVAGAAIGTLFAVLLWYVLLNRVVDDQPEDVVAGP